MQYHLACGCFSGRVGRVRAPSSPFIMGTEGKSQAGVGEAKGDDACSSGSGTASGCLSAIHLKNITCKLFFKLFFLLMVITQHSPILIHCRKTENISASYSVATNVHSRCRVNFHRTKRGCHVYTITVSCK